MLPFMKVLCLTLFLAGFAFPTHASTLLRFSLGRSHRSWRERARRHPLLFHWNKNQLFYLNSHSAPQEKLETPFLIWPSGKKKALIAKYKFDF